jgi:hypothetical protein
VVAMCNDGDCFGELALFDFKDNKGDSKQVYTGEEAAIEIGKRYRNGTCVAVEESSIFKISF